MPCQSDYPTIHRIENPINKDLKNRLDKVTRLLCGLCTEIEKDSNSPEYIKSDEELYQWWTDHKEQDRKRLEAEEKERKEQLKKEQAEKKLEYFRQKGLSKLTKAEKEALGLI